MGDLIFKNFFDAFNGKFYDEWFNTIQFYLRPQWDESLFSLRN